MNEDDEIKIITPSGVMVPRKSGSVKPSGSTFIIKSSGSTLPAVPDEITPSRKHSQAKEAARQKGYNARMEDKRAREIEAAEKAGAREAMTLKSKIKADVNTAREFVKALKPTKKPRSTMQKEIRTIEKVDKYGNITIEKTTHEKPIARAKAKTWKDDLVDAINGPATIGYTLAKRKAAREKAEAVKAKQVRVEAKRKSKPKLAARKGTIGRNQGTLEKRENTLVKHEANLKPKSARKLANNTNKGGPGTNTNKDGPIARSGYKPVKQKKSVHLGAPWKRK